MNFTLKKYFKWSLLSALCGLLSGIAIYAFLSALDWATKFRMVNSYVIWALPIAGLAIGYAYLYWGKEANNGTNLILDEIHDPKNTLPLRMAPLILISTVATHLFGGSAGREGTAVQMGSSLSDQLSRFFHVAKEERKILLVAGASAGFSAAIGAPLAGVIFGMEVIHIGRLRFFAWFECLIASFVAYYTTILLGVQHTLFLKLDFIDFNLKNLFFVFIAGIIFGLTANFFSRLTHLIEYILAKLIKHPPLKPFLAGVLLALLFYFEGSYRYAGLGLDIIQESLTINLNFTDAIYKTFFTSLTVGSGFKGGEFIPLVYIGSTLGNALALLLPISFKLLASVGFVAVFAGASNTPIACSLLAIELFGLSIAPYALIACLMSYYFSGHNGIYKSQKFVTKKHHELLNRFKIS